MTEVDRQTLRSIIGDAVTKLRDRVAGVSPAEGDTVHHVDDAELEGHVLRITNGCAYVQWRNGTRKTYYLHQLKVVR